MPWIQERIGETECKQASDEDDQHDDDDDDQDSIDFNLNPRIGSRDI